MSMVFMGPCQELRSGLAALAPIKNCKRNQKNMLFRLTNWTVLGLTAFYVAEGVGALERGQYFPTLPRLEASASDPSAWLGAAHWGITALTQGVGQAAEIHNLTGQGFSIAPRISTQQTQQPYRPIRLGAYAEPEATEAMPGILRRLTVGYYGG